jgi:hypothetical protein
MHLPVDCDDNNSYTNDYCDNNLGCVHDEYKYEEEVTEGY